MPSDIQILNGDCLELMATMPDNSVDAIITDPPYYNGMELNPEYCQRSRARIAWALENRAEILRGNEYKPCANSDRATPDLFAE